ncbi:class I SAM-dependent methyltransferase [Piscinibacter sp. HJYY11]|uniref:class I SAM-dependent methyltransferase n=1 Tax=Piscinibacter sp. HJYY11 TaxID=2801333 RepID=UPI00191D994D|nr:class I SAM-dependent methyltransferase [Piscinibacter sp. HJYY11]MBL0727633.1 class I SAM-dependent methyltransferase [Piscinibacter sp. HJYY11]
MWPLPALLVWGLCWGLFLGLRALEARDWASLLLATAAGAVLSLLSARRWRRVFIALGFPLSVLASGVAGGIPAWGWLLPLLALFALYPLHTWRDAPMFPTPSGALQGLSRIVWLDGENPRVVDAGCGMGDALRELHHQFPHARLDGLEWSWALRFACALRCKWLRVPARVKRADIWKADWTPYAMVYLFQRPESMPRAVRKAGRELRCGAWMASLEFEATELQPTAVHECADGRKLWLYQAPFKERAAAAG